MSEPTEAVNAFVLRLSDGKYVGPKMFMNGYNGGGWDGVHLDDYPGLYRAKLWPTRREAMEIASLLLEREIETAIVAIVELATNERSGGD